MFVAKGCKSLAAIESKFQMNLPHSTDLLEVDGALLDVQKLMSQAIELSSREYKCQHRSDAWQEAWLDHLGLLSSPL